MITSISYKKVSINWLTTLIMVIMYRKCGTIKYTKIYSSFCRNSVKSTYQITLPSCFHEKIFQVKSEFWLLHTFVLRRDESCKNEIVLPVVWRLRAFSDQPYPRVLAPGYPQAAQVFFWMWKLTLPQRRHKVWVLLRRLPNELVPLVCKVKQMN